MFYSIGGSSYDFYFDFCVPVEEAILQSQVEKLPDCGPPSQSIHQIVNGTSSTVELIHLGPVIRVCGRSHTSMRVVECFCVSVFTTQNLKDP